MERLTKRNGKYVEYSDENYNDSVDNYTMLDKCLSKLAEYEDAEEQGLLLRLPCKVGDDIYSIPSETNYRLNVLSKHEENNRVYHQKVARISFMKNGWYVECDKDVEYGTDRICIEQHFGITWFLDPTKAEHEAEECSKNQQKCDGCPNLDFREQQVESDE